MFMPRRSLEEQCQMLAQDSDIAEGINKHCREIITADKTALGRCGGGVASVRRDLVDKAALWLVVIGALHWLLVGLFKLDLVAAIFGGPDSVISRVVYTLIGVAGIWAISFLFRERGRA